MISSVSLQITISMFLMHSISFSLEFFEEKKLIAIINGIFHSTWVLWSFTILLKYDLILPRYYSVDCALCLSPLLSYSMQMLLKSLPVLIGSK